jgi:DNA-directed RNA polymerase subunit RPC12/RpoP
MSEDKVRTEGFEIFKKGLVRRLSPTHYVAKTLATEAWQLVELKNGKWSCDCKTEGCVHLYAAQVHRSTSKLQPEQVDESNLKCRYCGSPDVARCGFRYNARGISRRYRCNECQRKFSINHIPASTEAKPAEIVWLLNEIGMLTSKLTELLTELNDRMELASRITETPLSNIPDQNSIGDKFRLA